MIWDCGLKISPGTQEYLKRMGRSEGPRSDERGLEVRRGKGEAEGGSAEAGTQELRSHVKQVPLLAQPASHEEGSRNGRVEVATRDPRGRIDQNSQAQTIADGGSGQASAHGVGIAASTKEGEEEHAEKLGKHITKRDGM